MKIYTKPELLDEEIIIADAILTSGGVEYSYGGNIITDPADDTWNFF